MRLINLLEDDQATAVFAFGRFNPPTLGHEKLLQKVSDVAKSIDAKPYVFVSQTQDKKNPLSQQEKIEYIKSTGKFSDIQFGYTDVKTIVQALQKLMAEGRTKVVMIAGSDRLDYFKNFLNQYNKQKDKDGKLVFDFDNIDVVSSGDRDPDAEGVSGVSASQARKFAQDDDFVKFQSIIMNSPRDKEIFDLIKQRSGSKVAINTERLYNEVNGMNPVVYLDMDGVIVDFFGGVARYFGVSHWKELRQPGGGTEFKDEVMARLKGSDLFSKLPKFPTADHLIRIIMDFSPEGYTILSSPLRGDHENSAVHKKIWIKENLPIKPNGVIITGRKQKYAVQKDGTPNILIDDKPSNLDNWRAKGGYAIKYQANEDTVDTVKKALQDYDSRRNS